MQTSHTLTPPSPLTNMWVLISLELSRAFTSRQGLIYLGAFSFFSYLFINYGVLPFAFANGEQGGSMLGAIFKNYYSVATYAFPILCLFLAANQTGPDRERGTLRFISLRCSRDEIFFSRFISQILIQLVYIAFSLILLVFLATYQQGYDANVIPSALLALINIGTVIFPFVALMALVSVLVKLPRQATFYAGILWSLSSILMGLIEDYVPVLTPLNILVLGMQFSDLNEVEGAAKLSFAHVAFIQCGVLLLIGRFFMGRKSL